MKKLFFPKKMKQEIHRTHRKIILVLSILFLSLGGIFSGFSIVNGKKIASTNLLDNTELTDLRKAAKTDESQLKIYDATMFELSTRYRSQRHTQHYLLGAVIISFLMAAGLLKFVKNTRELK